MTRRRLFFSGLLLGMGGGREQASIDPLLRVWFLFFSFFWAGQGRARVMGGKLHWTSWFRHWVGVRRIGTARDTT